MLCLTLNSQISSAIPVPSSPPPSPSHAKAMVLLVVPYPPRSSAPIIWTKPATMVTIAPIRHTMPPT
jgi:hypothetical protein